MRQQPEICLFCQREALHACALCGVPCCKYCRFDDSVCGLCVRVKHFWELVSAMGIWILKSSTQELQEDYATQPMPIVPSLAQEEPAMLF